MGEGGLQPYSSAVWEREVYSHTVVLWEREVYSRTVVQRGIILLQAGQRMSTNKSSHSSVCQQTNTDILVFVNKQEQPL